jgi:hypothetical protein
MEGFGSEKGPVEAFMYTVMNCRFPSVSEKFLNIDKLLL